MAQAVQFAILGLGAGAAYTLLAQGIVLIYRGSGIVNFAHGAIAMFAAFFCFLTLREDHGWPLEAAIPVAVLLAALLGVVIQNGILRFMRTAAPLVRLVATLGVLIVLQGLAAQKLWDSRLVKVANRALSQIPRQHRRARSACLALCLPSDSSRAQDPRKACRSRLPH